MRLITLILIGLCWCAGARAEAPTPEATADLTMAATIDEAGTALRGVTSGLGSQALDDTELRARIAALPPIEAKLASALDILTPRLADADTRLAQLGPAPTAGQPPEAPEIASNRRSLTKFRQAVDTEVKQAKLLSVEADQVNDILTDRLRKNFVTRLWARSRSALDPSLWTDFAAAIPNDLGRLTNTIADEFDKVGGPGKTSHGLFGLCLALLSALLVLGPARVGLNWLAYREAPKWIPGSRLRRTALALWLVLVAGLTPVFAGILVRAGLAAAGGSTPGFDLILIALIKVTVFAATFEGLGRALLSPGRPSWRLAPLPDDVVARMAPFPGLIGATAGLATLAAEINTQLGSSAPTSAATDCLGVLIELGALGGALAMAGRARSAMAPTDDPTGHQAEARWPWVAAALAAWLALGVSLLAVAGGYLALANFLTRETIWIGAVLAALFLVLRFVDDLFPALLAPSNPLGRLIQTAIGFSDHALEQIGVLLSGLFRLIILIFGWAAIIAPFGASLGDIVARVTSTDIVIHLGQVTISPGEIFGGVAVLVLGLVVTRAIRGWLEIRYLPKTRMDLGLQTSLASAVTYLGGLIAIVITFAYLGLSFDRIALVASALSVGIGFGLQSIIGNFVSGLILLAERPVKVGDWIAIGEMEGDVKRINIRATEIEMMDKSKLIVPNSDLISKTVRNVTHTGSMGRVRIVLRTEYEADPTEVREILLARLKAHAEVLTTPTAAVYLSDVRDGGLEFTAFAYVASARMAFRVKSELLFQIVPDLKAHGVVMANSTPVVNVGMPDRPIEPAATAPEPEPEA